MEHEENFTELTDQRFEDILNDDSLIDDFAFQYRMYLLQIQEQTLEVLKEVKED
jgi:hypothetical protein